MILSNRFILSVILGFGISSAVPVVAKDNSSFQQILFDSCENGDSDTSNEVVDAYVQFNEPVVAVFENLELSNSLVGYSFSAFRDDREVFYSPLDGLIYNGPPVLYVSFWMLFDFVSPGESYSLVVFDQLNRPVGCTTVGVDGSDYEGSYPENPYYELAIGVLTGNPYGDDNEMFVQAGPGSLGDEADLLGGASVSNSASGSAAAGCSLTSSAPSSKPVWLFIWSCLMAALLWSAWIRKRV